jgi:hypothetical protein
MRRMRRIETPALGLWVAALALAPALPAGAAGMITHTWMAEEAIDLVETPELRALLLAHVDQVRSGAKFPDGGYFPGLIHGEEAHWQRFFDARVERLLARTDCGDLTDPAGPCAPEIAHLMGNVAHGTGDEVWDWLFEPNSPDRDEYYLHPDLSAFQDEGGQELVMDLVAIARYGVQPHVVPPLPSKPELIAAFAMAGLSGVTEAHLDTGQALFAAIYEVESAWAAQHADAVVENMPWMSAHLVTAPGGVRYAARSIAGQWETLWARILGQPHRTRISNTYPADGERGIPAFGWVRTYQPGSHRGRGGARTRIVASLTDSLPYRVPGGPGVSNQLPPGAMILSERDTGVVLPTLASFPRAVPYSADAGEHTIAIQPGVDLQACTWYRVDVTEALIDARNQPVEPYSWTFRTGADAEGTRCPDDPLPVECADGLDNDGDGLVDFPDDPGCKSADWPTESPRCQNGIDDDGDGALDFDGGAAANGGVALGSPDPECTLPYQDTEAGRYCGFGPELSLALFLLRAMRRRSKALLAGETSARR